MLNRVLFAVSQRKAQMKNFKYYRPETVEQAVSLLDEKWGTSELLAGGTDLLDLQKEYIAQPDKVVSLSAIGNITGINFDGAEIAIGAATKIADIAAHPQFRKKLPGLTPPPRDIVGP